MIDIGRRRGAEQREKKVPTCVENWRTYKEAVQSVRGVRRYMSVLSSQFERRQEGGAGGGGEEGGGHLPPPPPLLPLRRLNLNFVASVGLGSRVAILHGGAAVPLQGYAAKIRV